MASGLSSARWQPSGIDDVFFCGAGPPGEEGGDQVVSVGSFNRVKNLRLILEIAQAMPDVSFLLVGDGPEREHLEATCKAAGILNISFAGWLPHSVLARLLPKSKVFLSTSLVEGTPTAMLEAMASGLAVVTSRSNDYGTLILNGINGFVIEGFEGNKYVEKIRLLLSDDALLRKVSEENRTKAKSYHWREVANRLTHWMIGADAS
jgi:glycosyltransferase involved in cell wall biosynthesis